MTDFDSNQSHVREVRNAAMRSVLSILFVVLVAMTGYAQSQQQDSSSVKQDSVIVKKEKKIY